MSPIQFEYDGSLSTDVIQTKDELNLIDHPVKYCHAEMFQSVYMSSIPSYVGFSNVLWFLNWRMFKEIYMTNWIMH